MPDPVNRSKEQDNNSKPPDMRRRLDNVKARIDKMSPEGEKVLPNMSATGTNRPSGGRAMQIGSELIAGVVAGGLVGYGLDVWWGTKPLWFLIFFLLGIVAGLLNVLRTARKMQKERDEMIAHGRLDLGQDMPDDGD